ncbi:MULTISPECIES: hypothetical protein [unclassified Marinovum]
MNAPAHDLALDPPRVPENDDLHRRSGEIKAASMRGCFDMEPYLYNCADGLNCGSTLYVKHNPNESALVCAGKLDGPKGHPLVV